MAKGRKSTAKGKRGPVKDSPRPLQDEATIDDFEREGMGLAAKE